ncbi:MAG: low molecular weight protein arginine phosphatase [Hyphomonadaceae bacterium]|nr:low molecular weight protein arginine phosphatase [Clostridia bacterium]
MRILFICTGNTCRSPMAEGLMKKIILDQQCEGIEISSAGIAVFEEGGASENAIEAAAQLAVDLTSHQAKQFNTQMLAQADVVLTMTHQHKRSVLKAVPNANAFTVRAYAGHDGDVIDPYGGDLATYCACRDELVHLLLKITEKIVVEKKDGC